MADKPIKAIVKLNIVAGKANPAPPVGTALGPHGVNLMDFCNAYNARTKDKSGIVPAVITVFDDRSYEFVLKTPPASEMIKAALGIEKGSATPHAEKVGKLTQEQLRAIAEAKMQDLNALEVESAMRIVAGTARQMGVEILP